MWDGGSRAATSSTVLLALARLLPLSVPLSLVTDGMCGQAEKSRLPATLPAQLAGESAPNPSPVSREGGEG
jgi:hypothetical protein